MTATADLWLRRIKNNAVAATAIAAVFKIGVMDWRREGLGILGIGLIGVGFEEDEALMMRNLSGDGDGVKRTALMDFGGN